MAHDDMKFLSKPRGRGYSLRKATPAILVGTTNPWTDKPFGKVIKLGLNTTVYSEAVRLRDIRLGQIAQLEAEALAVKGRPTVGRIIELTAEAAAEWREARAHNPAGIDYVLPDKLEAAARAGKEKEARAFARMVYTGDLPIKKALEMYLKDRSDGNPLGLKTLAKTSQSDLRSIVGALLEALGDENATLREITQDTVDQYRKEFLPIQRGVGLATINKHNNFMCNMWNWAIHDRRLLRTRSGKPIQNPWTVDRRGVAKDRKAHKASERTMFEPAHVELLLSGFPRWGSRQSDLMRLLLVTGARVDEIGAMRLSAVESDGSGFTIVGGKTDNAARFIPVVEDAQRLLQRRVEAAPKHKVNEAMPSEDEWRLFPEWPLKPTTGKVNAVSQWFTRYRRERLGVKTDGSLAMHSFRHTWRTVASRAEVSEAQIKQLGGWSEGDDVSQVYNHGLAKEQLEQAQRKIWAALKAQGYLKAF